MGVVFGTTVLAGIFGRILYKWRAAKNGEASIAEAAPAPVPSEQPAAQNAPVPTDPAEGTRPDE